MAIAIPFCGAVPDPASLTEENIFDFSSCYIQRALHIIPKNADRMPWRLSQNYVQDRIDMRTGAIDDGILARGHAHPAAVSAAPLEAAESSVDRLGLAHARPLASTAASSGGKEWVRACRSR